MIYLNIIHTRYNHDYFFNHVDNNIFIFFHLPYNRNIYLYDLCTNMFIEKNVDL